MSPSKALQCGASEPDSAALPTSSAGHARWHKTPVLYCWLDCFSIIAEAFEQFEHASYASYTMQYTASTQNVTVVQVHMPYTRLHCRQLRVAQHVLQSALVSIAYAS